MKKNRTYKHSKKFYEKKAEKEKKRAQKLEQRKQEKIKEILNSLAPWRVWDIIIYYIEVECNINIFEYLFGSFDFVKQKRIEVVRKYLKDVLENNGNPTPAELEEFFISFAVEVFCRELGIDIEFYNSLKTYKLKQYFIENAVKFVFEHINNIDDFKKNLNLGVENLIKCAEETYKKINTNDLRRGNREQRKERKMSMVKIILKHFKSLENKTISFRELSKMYQYDRGILAKYYKIIKNSLMMGLEINDSIFEEKKRGKKSKSNKPTISKEILSALEKDLEDIPEKCGLKYASWTGKAIQDYLDTLYDIQIDLKDLYKILEANDITSKFASRKNPKSDPIEVAKFKKSVYGKFKKAILNGETVVFIDETQVQQGSHTRGFAKKGKRAVYSYGTENLHCEYTLLTIVGFDFVMIFKHKGTMTSEDYVGYLLELNKKYAERKFLIFQDNARIHTSEEFEDCIYAYGLQNSLRFEFFPKYTPELNPVELFNNEFKASLKKYACEGKEEVSKNADRFIEIFQDKNRNSKHSGRRKAKQYTKGEDCSFIYSEYLRAMLDVRRIKLRERKLSKNIKSA